MGVATRGQRQDGNGDEYEDGIGEGEGEGEGEAKKSKKPQNTCRRHVGNGGDLGGKRKIRRKERVGPVAANSDNLDNSKKAGGGGTTYLGLK